VFNAQLWFRSSTNYLGKLIHNNTADRTYTLPNKDITVAGLDDVAASATTVADTTSIDLTLSGTQVSGVVLPAGVDHNFLANLTTGDPHTQYAPKASPTFTGTPAAPTAALGTNTTQIATTALMQGSLPSLAQGRLTLTSGTPIPTSDVTGATNVYWTPYGGNRIALVYSGVLCMFTFAEITLALGTLTSGLPYDVFAYYTGSAVAVESLAWTNGTTRATNIVLTGTGAEGFYTKSGDATRRYLGTFYTTSTTTTEDSAVKRFLFNADNPVPKPLVAVDTTPSWTYTTNTLREARGGSTYGVSRVGVMRGLNLHPVEVHVCGEASQTGTAGVHVDVGIDDSTTGSAQVNPVFTVSTSRVAPFAHYYGSPSAGFHYFAWLETSQAAGTTTWWGGSVLNSDQPGLAGKVWC